VDLPGSNAEEMYYSLFERLAKLAENLIIYPGHNYGPTPTSTIRQEKQTNYILQPRSKQEFLEFMAAGE
jgi:glyoxylase-like metal-dependent hydrolase (beta-lactamase superfamily II)